MNIYTRTEQTWQKLYRNLTEKVRRAITEPCLKRNLLPFSKWEYIQMYCSLQHLSQPLHRKAEVSALDISPHSTSLAPRVLCLWRCTLKHLSVKCASMSLHWSFLFICVTSFLWPLNKSATETFLWSQIKCLHLEGKLVKLPLSCNKD